MVTTVMDGCETLVDARELFALAHSEFVVRLNRVGDRWEAPTPCPGWDVRGLVEHVVAEQAWAVPLLGGATIAEIGDRFAGDLLGADPVAVVEATGAAALAAVGADGVLDRTVHLSFGDVTAGEYVMQLAADHLVHAWDLACALGDDDRLDPRAVAAVLDWFVANEGQYRRSGMIGPRTQQPTNATAQDELLVMFGRAPGWGPVARFNAAFATQDVDAVMAAMTPDCVFEDTTPPDGGRHVGAAAVRAAWVELFAAAPLGRFDTEEVVAVGDRVVVRWCYQWGSGHVRGIDLFLVRDGLVAEKLAYVKG